jgi:hypothetical protein
MISIHKLAVNFTGDFLFKELSFLAGYVEKRVAKKIYGVVSVVDEIVERFKKYQPNRAF